METCRKTRLQFRGRLKNIYGKIYNPKTLKRKIKTKMFNLKIKARQKLSK